VGGGGLADQSLDLFDGTALDGSVVDSSPFAPPLPLGKVLKRIPRGARDASAAELQRLLQAVERAPDERPAWIRLFAFAGSCLRQPSDRGGKLRNLTTAVINNIKAFSAGQEVQEHYPRNAMRATLKADSASTEAAVARRAAAKLDEGDVRGAIRHLCSSDMLQKPTPLTFRCVQEKHPPAPVDRRSFDSSLPCAYLAVTSNQVLEAIKSFPSGSSGGPDGLRPQHLKDMINKLVGGGLLDTLTEFVNFVLAGNIPDWVRPFFFGASLFAFSKKDGGIRPIAVGLTLRRLVAKVASRSVANRGAELLKPRQLGVGVKGGAEALAHGARRFVDCMPDSFSFVKLDFANAFNTIRRDSMLEAVASQMPELLGYVNSAYGSSSNLSFGEYTVESAEGIQQGDPLGPLLFCLTIQPLLLDIQSELVSGYLDDIAIGGETGTVASDVLKLECQAGAMGLHLNHHKCEIISKIPSNLQAWKSHGFNFKETPLHEATLLGAPISAGQAVDSALASKRAELELLIKRLSLIPSHPALYLLRNALAIPKLLYLMRTAPCFESLELGQYDELLRTALSSLLNVDLSLTAWSQANLPVRWGGVGVRSAHQLAPSAFLASAAGAADLLSSLLPAPMLATPDPEITKAVSAWRILGGTALPNTAESRIQRKWDEPICQAVALHQRLGADESTTARLLAVCSPGAGAWLNAIPCSTLGLSLDDNSLRVVVGLRLGVPLVLPHQCQCGAQVDRLGHHGLACRRSSGRHSRHTMMNETILRALQSANVPAVREPPGLTRSDAKRPDGATLVPWAHGRCLLWDATTPDTLAPSHVQRSAVLAGSAALSAQGVKTAKYTSLAVAHDFVPIAIETLGTWGPAGLAFVNELGRRISAVTGDARATDFLRQRLSLAVQRGNAASILGTLVSPDTDLFP